MTAGERAARPIRTLSARLLLSFGAIALLSLVLYGSFLAIRSFQDGRQMLGSFSRYLADSIAMDLADAVMEGHQARINAKLQTQKASAIPTQICVYDRQARLAEFRPNTGPACPDSPDDDLTSHLHALSPIRQQDAVIGFVTVHIEEAIVRQRVWRQLTPLLIGLVASFALVMLLTWQVARRLSTSLGMLTKRARTYTTFEQGFDPPADAPKEVVDMAEAFQVLVDDLVRARQQALLEADYRRIAQEAETRARHLLGNIIRNVPYAVFARRSDGSMLFANTAAAALYGTTVDELLTVDFQHRIGRLDGVLATANDDPLHQPQEIDFVSPDGGSHRLLVSRNQVEGTEIQVTIAVDVTQIHRLQTQLQFAQRLEMVGTLAGGIAHDFNNLLTPILGYSSLLETRPLPPDVLDKLALITSAATRARMVVQQILTFSRQQEPKRESVSLGTLVESTMSLLRATIPSSISIIHEVTAEVRIHADPGQIEQVLVNLVTNAAQAFGQQSGRIEVRVSTRTLGSQVGRLHPGHYAELLVTDNGPGMSESVRTHIFEPFFTTKAVGEGSGLGLSVVHGIIENHQGAIEVTSEPGRGSTFSLLLPVEAPESVETIACGQIMLVEDSNEVLDVMTDMIGTLGYAVQGFGSGAEALASLQRHPEAFVLLVTDQQMPAMTGDELAAAARQILPDLPIILLTGYDDRDITSEHIDQIITKPVSIHTLRQALERMVASAAV